MSKNASTKVDAPSWDEEAERAVLGAMLANPTAVPSVTELLVEDDFFHSTHRLLYRKFCAIWAHGKELDPVLACNALPEHRDLIHSLYDGIFTAANVMEYARAVHNEAQRRALRLAGQRIVEFAAGEDEVPALVDRAEQEVYAINPSRRNQPKQLHEVSARLILDQDTVELATVHQTGFPRLDDLVGGFRPGNLVILAARPGIGKTALAAHFAAHTAKKGRVLFFSLEMAESELAERLLCAAGSVHLKNMREHRLSDRERVELDRVQARFEKLDLVIDDTPGQTLLSIRGAVRREVARSEVALVVIDYLQLLTLGYKAESRFVEVSTISRELKELARRASCPILALSQLNRESESNFSDGKPKLAHLRESGSIEQDADTVVLLSWPSKKEREKDGRDGLVRVDVAKNRHGPIGEVWLRFTPEYTRYGNG
jgi:replicative DNA helicase